MDRRALLGTTTKPKHQEGDTYTPLTYIECTGEQYINLGYVVQEDDIIEMKYISTSTASSDKMLFGSYDSDGGYIWFSLYSNTAYVRFGTTSSVSVTNARMKYNLTMKKGSCTVGNTTESRLQGESLITTSPEAFLILKLIALQ